MTLRTARFEVYASGPGDPAAVWDLVSDPHRLPEWTDATAVEDLGPGPVAVGTTFAVRVGDRRLDWRVRTLDRRLIEAATFLPSGVLGIGAQVFPDAAGSRIVLAGAFAPADRRSALRFSLLGGPDLRRRFDRWSPRALRPPRSRR